MPKFSPDKLEANKPAVLLTTSGTTGQLKFVAHSPMILSAIADSLFYLALMKSTLQSTPYP